MITRKTAVVNATILSGAALSDAIGFGPYTGGVMLIPAAWTAADLGFVVNDISGGTFLQLIDNGVLVEITGIAVDLAYPIPAELFGAMHFKLWSQSAGVDVNQDADRVIKITLKA